MLKITLIAVGSLKEPHWKAAQEEYLRRLQPYAKLELTEVAAEPFGGSVTAAQSMQLEGERILKRIPDGAEVFALERTGKEMDSPAFARAMQDAGGDGTHLVFIVGGAAGLSTDVLAKCRRKLSLSQMTLIHEMARVFLLEQIYRGTTILANKPYHL